MYTIRTNVTMELNGDTKLGMFNDSLHLTFVRHRSQDRTQLVSALLYKLLFIKSVSLKADSDRESCCNFKTKSRITSKSNETTVWHLLRNYNFPLKYRPVLSKDSVSEKQFCSSIRYTGCNLKLQHSRQKSHLTRTRISSNSQYKNGVTDRCIVLCIYVSAKQAVAVTDIAKQVKKFVCSIRNIEASAQITKFPTRWFHSFPIWSFCY
jgi:hypothetical protein